MGKYCKSHFSRIHEFYEMSIQLLFNMDRKSYMIFRLTAFAFTVGNLERSYHGPHIYSVHPMPETVQFKFIVTIKRK